MKLSDFKYQLPENLIAQSPIEPRDHSRLMLVNRETGRIEHRHFYDLAEILGPNDVLVRNNTKVIPARIIGHKETGGAIEVLIIRVLETNEKGEVWECLTKPGLKLGQVLNFEHSDLSATCIEVTDYTRVIQFNQKHLELMLSLDKIGQTPLPPYIEWHKSDEAELRQRYQTIYAQYEGSVAAPTAGLHFTPDLDTKLRQKGIQIEEVTLHVGLGTFLPVKTDDITDHHMHTEWYELQPDVAERLNQARAEGKRIIAVGTTTCRVLETCSSENGVLQAGSGETSIFMYPPYRFKFVQGLITNFHLSESTLLMLVSAFVSAPNTQNVFKNFEQCIIGVSYQEAIKEQYRFYSFGDGMLVI